MTTDDQRDCKAVDDDACLAGGGKCALTPNETIHVGSTSIKTNGGRYMHADVGQRVTLYRAQSQTEAETIC